MAHPLTLLRASLGLSQSEYARLVAGAHDELGLGRMAARREKVSRWESGRIVPEYSAQRAMAHLHGVSAREVTRLGWPFWVHLATGDGVPLDEAHADPRPQIARAGPRLSGPVRPTGFAQQGDRLVVEVRGALARLAGFRPVPGREADAETVECLDGIEARVAALEEHSLASLLPPRLLYAAAHTEHRQLARLSAAADHGGATSRRLLRLSARTALLCSGFSRALGELARAEHYALAAIRAAAAAGDRVITATAMIQLALHHLVASGAQDALGLLHAARLAAPELPAVIAFELHNCRAAAFAQLGRAASATRALDLATGAFTPADRVAAGRAMDPEAYRRFVAMSRAGVWTFLGRPRQAKPHLEFLVDSLTTPGGATPPPYSALWFLYIVNGHLALGELDVAATAVHHIGALTGGLPPALVADLRRLLAPHRHERLLREALDDLSTASEP
ncbi:hypothetical protein [Kitasatospora sp. NPDC093806]|uniref:hypothetical protein n=1 Tax=Kitasatospora sp. NPDC093806 TaxID=3155075 RepID=UPI00344163AF